MSRNKGNSKIVPVKKPTHLYLNDKFITNIKNNLTLDNLTVLYLHNNNINKIENLNFAINLRSLYLQKNKISKIENLSHLENLNKLYLGHNEISVVEGLENLKNLKELYIEKQRLNNGDSLCFDSRSIASLAGSLEILNISHNNVSSIACLTSLQFIKAANIGFNKLTNMREVCDTIHNWYYLGEVTFTGNPIVKQRRYRENIISYTFRLAVLDNKEVNDVTRTFIKRFEQERINNPHRRTISLTHKTPDLAKNYPLPVQKAVSQAMLQNTKPCFDNTTMHSNVNDIYLPWNALPKSSSNIGKNIPTSLKRNEKLTNKANTHKSMFPGFI